MAQLSYRRHRFPARIIQHAIWLYLRFTVSYRDAEELLAEGRLTEGGVEGIIFCLLQSPRPVRSGRVLGTNC
jgi:hypothetical protein